MKTQVVHCRKETYDVYIGRPSKWGNPFTHRSGTKAEFLVATRLEAVRRFREWILEHPTLLDEAREELKGKILGCWCKPQACHGDVLAELVEADEH